MTSRPRFALTRQMHFFGELKAAAEDIRRRRPEGADLSTESVEDMAWREALRRRAARLAAT